MTHQQTTTGPGAFSHTLPPWRLSRRRLLRQVAAGGALAALGGLGYAVGIEPVWPQHTRCVMAIPDLGHELVGFRIIQISDLHVGDHVPITFLQKWVNWINRQRADLVVLTGDIVHHGQPKHAARAGQLLGRLQATEGVLAVLGNHDWGTNCPGRGSEPLANRVSAAIAQGGTRLLRNESILVRRGKAQLGIVGLDDYWGRQFDPDGAFAQVPAAMPSIVLSHNPDTFVELLDQPACWVLSGHTHGGQVRLPLTGAPYLPIRHKRFVAGHYVIGDHNLYVNRGLGWLLRIRFNARPEITEFTLTRA